MNRTNIDYLDYTWSPVVGCKRACPYCWARQLHNMRHKAYLEGKKLPIQYAKPFEEIQFFPERLDEPAKVKKPSTIGVCFTSDLFGNGEIQDYWIYQIIAAIRKSPQHTFMFLTKNSNGYAQWYPLLPENCMLGLTQTIANQREISWFIQCSAFNPPLPGFPNRKLFLSLEPLLGSFEGISFAGIDLIIVGAMTGKKHVKPALEWVQSIKHPNIIYKENLLKIYPNLKSNEPIL